MVYHLILTHPQHEMRTTFLWKHMETITGWKATLGIHWSSELICSTSSRSPTYPGIALEEPFLFLREVAQTPTRDVIMYMYNVYIYIHIMKMVHQFGPPYVSQIDIIFHAGKPRRWIICPTRKTQFWLINPFLDTT